jgi:tetratricopeptide (TPR) repeat protein
VIPSPEDAIPPTIARARRGRGWRGFAVSIALLCLAAFASSGCSRSDPESAGVRAFEKGDLKTAVDKLERVVREHPDKVAAQVYLGRAYAGRRDWDRAHKTFAALRQREPAYLDGYYWDADAYLEDGRARLARDNPDDALAVLDRGAAQLNELLRQKTDRSEAWELLATIQLERFLAFSMQCRQLLDETFGSVESTRTMHRLNQAIYGTDFKSELNALVTKLRERGFPGAAALAGPAQGAEEAFHQTQEFVKRAITQNPKLSTAQLGLAQLFVVVGQKENAKQACLRLFEIPDEGKPDERTRIRRDKVKARFLIADLLTGPADEDEEDADSSSKKPADRKKPAADAGPPKARREAEKAAAQKKKDAKHDAHVAGVVEAIGHVKAVLDSKELPKADQIEARVRLCRYYFESKNLEAMNDEAKTVHKLEANNPAGNLFRGIELEHEKKYEQAAELIEQGLVETFAGFADGWLCLGRALSKLPGKEDQAIEALSHCVRLDPDAREARVLRADLYSRIGWFHDAQTEIEHLLADRPDDLALQGKLREAEDRRYAPPPNAPKIETPADARAVLARDSTQSWARRRLVELLLDSSPTASEKDRDSAPDEGDDASDQGGPVRRSEWHEASVEAHDLVDANPDSYVAERLYGRALFATGDIRRAERSIAHSVALQPRLPDGYADFGKLLIQEGKYARGISQLKAGLRRDPTSIDIAVELARLYAEKGYPNRAKKALDEIHVQGTPPAKVRCVRSEIALAEGDLDGAVDGFRALLAEDPLFAMPRLGLARVYALRHDPEAIPTYRSFLRESEGKIDYIVPREAALRMLLREQLASRKLEDVLGTLQKMRRSGDVPGAAAVLARFYFDRGDYPVALAHCRFGLAGTSDLGDLHLVWGDIANRLGNRKKAIEEWTAAVASDPTLTDARLKIAESYRAAGENKAASRAYGKTLKLAYDRPEIYRGIALVVPDEPRPGVARTLDKMQKKLENKGPIFGLDAVRARLALVSAPVHFDLVGLHVTPEARAAIVLSRESPAALTGEERAALALLRLAAHDRDGVAAAWEPAAAFESDPMRAQTLALVALERNDADGAAAICETQLRASAAAGGSEVDSGAVGFEGAREDFRGERAVRATLACIRLVQGRPEDAVELAQQTSTGDERRDFASLLRLLGANPAIGADAAVHFARALAFRSSAFTLGLAVRETDALGKAVPGHPLPYLLLANLEIERGNRPKAGKLLAEAIVRNSDHAPSYVRRAYLAADAGRIKDAWASLVQASESCGDSTDVQAAQGALAARARKQGLVAKAPAVYFGTALEIAQREAAGPLVLASLHRSLAHALQASGDLERAIAHYREARRSNPTELRTGLQLAILLLRKASSARTESVVSTAPGRSVADEIDEAANDLVRDFPARPESWLVRARAQEERGNFEDARATLEKSLRDVDPFDVRTRLELVRVLEKLGESAGAVDREERTIVLLHPGKSDVHARIAARATSDKKLPDAETHLREALLFKPTDRSLVAAFLKVALVREDWKEANRVVEKAREAFPRDGEIRFLVAEVLHRQGRETEALREYLEAESLLPRDALVHAGLAEVYLARDLPAMARSEAQAAKDIDPNCQRAADVLDAVAPASPNANPKGKRRPGAGGGGARKGARNHPADDSGDGR